MVETYSLAELADRAGQALDALGVQVGSRRVRSRPDARTVRYYSQVGLVDRPLPTAGREATYGRRHLVQLVAVKRLQAAGVTLADIQRRLTGAGEAELLAAIGPDAETVLASTDGAASAPPEPRPARAEAFWRTPTTAPAPSEPAPSAEPAEEGVREVLVVRLAPGVELAVEGAADVDVTALRAAARPLVEYVRTMTGDEEDGE